jgi:hypothetical protein
MGGVRIADAIAFCSINSLFALGSLSSNISDASYPSTSSFSVSQYVAVSIPCRTAEQTVLEAVFRAQARGIVEHKGRLCFNLDTSCGGLLMHICVRCVCVGSVGIGDVYLDPRRVCIGVGGC